MAARTSFDSGARRAAVCSKLSRQRLVATTASLREEWNRPGPAECELAGRQAVPGNLRPEVLAQQHTGIPAKHGTTVAPSSQSPATGFRRGFGEARVGDHET